MPRSPSACGPRPRAMSNRSACSTPERRSCSPQRDDFVVHRGRGVTTLSSMARRDDDHCKFKLIRLAISLDIQWLGRLVFDKFIVVPWKVSQSYYIVDPYKRKTTPKQTKKSVVGRFSRSDVLLNPPFLSTCVSRRVEKWTLTSRGTA